MIAGVQGRNMENGSLMGTEFSFRVIKCFKNQQQRGLGSWLSDEEHLLLLPKT